MKTAMIRSSWMEAYGYRLDCQPYLGGALEAKIILERLSLKKEPLSSLTVGHNGGIYNGPHFARTYVDSEEYGVPFVSSSGMLHSDLSRLPLLSRRQTADRSLAFLRLGRGTSLISCSGTIGRMAYVRSGMEGMWSSQDILKVVPNEERIPSGYLYAFLSSNFGVPLVASGTYGAIIQHLEPHHIADLPVPRLGTRVERRIHALIEDAAGSLDRYGRLLASATEALLQEIGMVDISPSQWSADTRRLGWSQETIEPITLRALNYDARVIPYFQTLRSRSYSELGSLCEPEAFRGRTVFKRLDAEGEYSVRLVGQREAFHIRPDGRLISRASVEDLGLMVPPGATLIPAQGTLGEQELYCRAVYATRRTSEYLFSGGFLRCVPRQAEIPGGFLFAFLRSNVAFRMLRSMSVGDKRQEQHAELILRMPIPRLEKRREAAIARQINEAADCFDHALDCEDKARAILENAIQEQA